MWKGRCVYSMYKKPPISDGVVNLRLHWREWLTKEFMTGYLIPKGWKVMPLFRNFHHNQDFFPDPQKFDPSRFEVWVNIVSRLKLVKLQFLGLRYFYVSTQICYLFFSSLFLFIVFLGCPKTQYIYAVWQWSTCLSRKWACKDGNVDRDPPFSYQVQVLYKRKYT